MAIKNALWTRIANGIISVGKKLLDTSIDNNKVSESKHLEANGEMVKNPLSDKSAEKAFSDSDIDDVKVVKGFCA
jgi:hypothetical protein